MGDFLTKTQEQFIIFRLLLVKIVIVMIVNFCIAWHTSMAQIKFSNLDKDERFYTLCGIAMQIGISLIAFLDKTAGSLARGKLPIGDEDRGSSRNTEFINKTEVVSTTVSVPKTEPPKP